MSHEETEALDSLEAYREHLEAVRAQKLEDDRIFQHEDDDEAWERADFDRFPERYR